MRTIARVRQPINRERRRRAGKHEEKASSEAPVPAAEPVPLPTRKIEQPSDPGVPVPRHPRPKAWCRALTSLKGERKKQKRRVAQWLVAQLAITRPDADPLRERQHPGPLSPDRQAPGDPLGRAVEPTVQRLHELAKGTSPSVKKLLEIIADHYCESDHLIFQMCRQAKLTGWDLKVFRRELGITAKRLLLQCRRETSSVLLRDTSLSMAVIARLVGFKTARSLRRIYSDRAGMSPSKMRHCLRQVVPELRTLGDELRGWYFWARHHRGELKAADYRAALAYLDDCFGE